MIIDKCMEQKNKNRETERYIKRLLQHYIYTQDTKKWHTSGVNNKRQILNNPRYIEYIFILVTTHSTKSVNHGLCEQVFFVTGIKRWKCFWRGYMWWKWCIYALYAGSTPPLPRCNSSYFTCFPGVTVYVYFKSLYLC